MNKAILPPRDIKYLPESGYLVFPISISNIDNTQSADKCFEMLNNFSKKISKIGIDVIFLYTNGLYFNADELAVNLRQKINQKISNHYNRIRMLIEKSKQFVPQAFHYLPWDYVLLNSENFKGYYNILKDVYSNDDAFRMAVNEDLKYREITDANVNFIIEELVITHLIRQKMTILPKSLVIEDNYRMIIYTGAPLKSDSYQVINKMLPLNKKVGSRGYPYASGIYNYNDKLFHDLRYKEN